MDQRSILVLGVTGLMGRRLADHLANRFPEAQLKGAARSAMAKSAELPENVHPVDIDIEAPGTYEAAFDGVTDLVLAVAGRPGKFDTIEHRGVVAAAKAAVARGVRRIIHITGTAAPTAPDWFEAGAAKRYAESEIQALPATVVTLRPSWLMEALPRFERNGGMALIGSGDTAMHWLALNDLAEIVAQVLEMPDTAAGAYPVLGPERISLMDAASRYARARELKPGIRAMPLPLARLVAFAKKDLRPIVELTRMFDGFDEAPLAGIETPFRKPTTTLDQWLG